jgi:ParB/RepB/Spo0J family partition protein
MPDVELKRIQPTKLNPRTKFSKSGLDDLVPLPRTCSAWERGRPGRWAAVICAGRAGETPPRPGPPALPKTSAVSALAARIEQFGILELILVSPVHSHYQVVVGERRYRAAQQARLDTVPVVSKHYTDEELLEINLVENMQREDLSAVEKARLCQELRHRNPARYPTWDAVARRVGVEPATIRTWVRTLGLPDEVKDRIAPREKQRVPEG